MILCFYMSCNSGLHIFFHIDYLFFNSEMAIVGIVSCKWYSVGIFECTEVSFVLSPVQS